MAPSGTIIRCCSQISRAGLPDRPPQPQAPHDPTTGERSTCPGLTSTLPEMPGSPGQRVRPDLCPLPPGLRRYPAHPSSSGGCAALRCVLHDFHPSLERLEIPNRQPDRQSSRYGELRAIDHQDFSECIFPAPDYQFWEAPAGMCLGNGQPFSCIRAVCSWVSMDIHGLYARTPDIAPSSAEAV